jgi:acetate kinase
MDRIEERIRRAGLTAAEHRVVHGGLMYGKPQRITAEMAEELHQPGPFAPDHLPSEILPTEASHLRFADLPQTACSDTAFHHDLLRVARFPPIQRGSGGPVVRISPAFSFVSDGRAGCIAGAEAEQSGVLPARLGKGTSLAAARGGKPVDTSRSGTPTAGVPKSARSGDLDPEPVFHPARREDFDARRSNEMVNSQSRLLGISETSSYVRDLLDCETQDVRAAEAIALFCYRVKKWISAFAAALDGMDMVVNSNHTTEPMSRLNPSSARSPPKSEPPGAIAIRPRCQPSDDSEV